MLYFCLSFFYIFSLSYREGLYNDPTEKENTCPMSQLNMWVIATNEWLSHYYAMKVCVIPITLSSYIKVLIPKLVILRGVAFDR